MYPISRTRTLLGVVIALVASACGGDCILLPCAGIVGERTLAVDEATQLRAGGGQGDPELAGWNSSDTSVAVVDEDGTVTAVGVGSTTIRALALYNSDCCSDGLVSHDLTVESGSGQ